MLLSLGQKIKLIREFYHLNQAEFAQLLGLKQRAISAWENEVSEPSISSLQILVNKLYVDMNWLIWDEPYVIHRGCDLNLIDLARLIQLRLKYFLIANPDCVQVFQFLIDSGSDDFIKQLEELGHFNSLFTVPQMSSSYNFLTYLSEKEVEFIKNHKSEFKHIVKSVIKSLK